MFNLQQQDVHPLKYYHADPGLGLLGPPEVQRRDREYAV